MALSPGQVVLDRYVIEALLGEGGMGQVFRARHSRLGFPVAVKVLALSDDPAHASRFEREAMMMARVQHPNVVNIMDFGVLPDGRPCIAMEFVQGEPLDRKLRLQGALRAEQAARFLRGVLAGLSAMHGASVLHRDLKPGNVVVTPGPPEVAKLIDFGIAIPTEGRSQRITRTGDVIGTPAYMAPEQLLCYPMDARTDLYAAGLLGYLMVTGRLPFPSEDMTGVMRRLADPAPTPKAPEGLPPLPRGLAELLLKLLNPVPDGRYGSAAEALAALEAVDWNEEPDDELSAPTVEGALEVSGVMPGRGAPPVADSEPPMRYLVAARLPPSRLASRVDREFLAKTLAGSGRAYVLGNQFWFAVQNLGVSAGQARAEAQRIASALGGRYGATASISFQLVGANFGLTSGALSGATPLPAPLSEMLGKLGG